MNSEKLKGTIDVAAGSAKRKVGEWTGSTKTEVEGAAQQIKGKAEKAVGAVKDAVHDAQKDADKNRKNDTTDNRDHETVVSVQRK